MNSFSEIFAEIKKHDSFYLSGHVNPDGDSKGSCECLKLALESLGSEVYTTCGFGGMGTEVQPTCTFTDKAKVQVDYTSVPIPPKPQVECTSDPKVDCFIQLDVQPEYRLPKESLEVKKSAKVSICFDHHQPEDANCTLAYVDSEAAACALII